MVLENPIEL